MRGNRHLKKNLPVSEKKRERTYIILLYTKSDVQTRISIHNIYTTIYVLAQTL